MASFSSLPLKLLLHISQALEFPDVKSLSSLNLHFRKLFIPLIFRSVRFTNLPRDEEHISGVVTEFATHIKKLRFEFHLQRDSERSHRDRELPEALSHKPEHGAENHMVPGTILTPAAIRILSGEWLSGVSSLTVKFLPDEDFDGEGWGDSQDLGNICIFEDVLSLSRAATEEAAWPSWRRAMAQMWAVLRRNEGITSFEIDNLPALVVSSWGDAEWTAFLGRLTSLTLRIGGGDNGVGWQANTMDGYRDFLENLAEYFFKDTKSLRKLHLVADRWNYYGENDGRSMPTAIRMDLLPELEEIRVENCFVDDNLCRDILAASRAHLKKLQLVNCMANSETPTWATLFTRLASIPSLSLHEFVVVSEKVEFHESLQSQLLHLPVSKIKPVGREVIALRSSPAEDSLDKSRPFAYGTVDMKYGMVFHDVERNWDEFESGVDMEAYRRLMQVLADKGKGTPKSQTERN